MSDPIVLLVARRERVPQLRLNWCPALTGAALHELVESMMTPGPIIETDGKTSAEILYKGVAPGSANEIWVTGKGERIKIGDMDHKHLVHALALVMRTVRQKGGHWALNEKGALRHYYRFPNDDFWGDMP